MQSPIVTIILTSFNHAKYIAEAIQSVIDQTFQDFELLIIDDSSTDISWDIISTFSDERIRAFRNETRCRGAKGINELIQFRARGKYIAILHSDDKYLPSKIEKQVKCLDEHLDIGAVFTFAQGINEQGLELIGEENAYCNIFYQPNRTRHEWLNYFFYNGNCLCHPSVMIRRSCYEDIGYYDRRFGSLIDFDMWIRLCFKYDIHIIQECLVSFRILAAGKNSSGDNTATYIRSYNEMYQILFNYLAVENINELTNIFTEISDSIDEPSICIKYLLAILALNNGHRDESANVYFVARRAFGLNLLYDLMRDPRSAEKLATTYGYDYLKLIETSAEVDTINWNSVDIRHKNCLNPKLHSNIINSKISFKYNCRFTKIIALIKARLFKWAVI